MLWGRLCSEAAYTQRPSLYHVTTLGQIVMHADVVYFTRILYEQR